MFMIYDYVEKLTFDDSHWILISCLFLITILSIKTKFDYLFLKSLPSLRVNGHSQNEF